MDTLKPIPNTFQNNINADKVVEREAAAAKRRPWKFKINDVKAQTPAQRAEERAERRKALAKGVNAAFDSARAQKLSRRDAAREIEQELAEHLGFVESVAVSDVGVILDIPDLEVQRMVKAGKLESRNGRVDADSLVTYIAMRV